MDLSNAIARFARDVERITHTGGGYDDDGIAIPPTETIDTIRATVQPLTGTERQNLPEGTRDNAQMTMWTLESIAKDDRFVIDGQTYFVLERQDRALGGFWRATLGDASNAS